MLPEGTSSAIGRESDQTGFPTDSGERLDRDEDEYQDDEEDDDDEEDEDEDDLEDEEDEDEKGVSGSPGVH